MTQIVQETADKVPTEIQAAVKAFDGKTEQAVVVTLLNEGKLAFSELQDKLSDEDDELHNQTLTDALEALRRGGLINRRTTGDDSSRFRSYYEVSEYGERFVDRLLYTLGTKDSLSPSESPPEQTYERVDNIHDQTREDEPPIRLEWYHTGDDTGDDANQVDATAGARR